MIRVRLFQADDLDQLGDLRTNIGETPLDALKILYRLGPALTACWGETVLGCAGIVRLDADGGEGWCIMSTAGRRHAVGLMRLFRRVLPRLVAEMGLSRLRATIDVADVAALRFAEALGFVPQGEVEVPGLGSGRYVRCSRVV